MKLSLTALALTSDSALALTSDSALADTIALGYSQGPNSATQARFIWREGQDDPCSNSDKGWSTPIITTSSSPCELKFTLPNGKGYRLKNCGSSTFSLHYYQSQTFISRATWAPWQGSCPYGVTVTKEWQFQCDKPGWLLKGGLDASPSYGPSHRNCMRIG